MDKSSEPKKKKTEDVVTFEHRCFDPEWVEKQYQKYLNKEKLALNTGDSK